MLANPPELDEALLSANRLATSVPISDITGQVVAIAWPTNRTGAIPDGSKIFR